MTNNIILYTTDDGKAKVELYEFGESLYLAQNAMPNFLPPREKISQYTFAIP